MTDIEVRDLLIRLAKLSQRGITITSSYGNLKTNPKEPNDPDFKKAEPVLKTLLESKKLHKINVNSAEEYLSFKDKETYDQFKKVAERELGTQCGWPGGKTRGIVGWIKFNPKETPWVRSENP